MLFDLYLHWWLYLSFGTLHVLMQTGNNLNGLLKFVHLYKNYFITKHCALFSFCRDMYKLIAKCVSGVKASLEGCTSGSLVFCVFFVCSTLCWEGRLETWGSSSRGQRNLLAHHHIQTQILMWIFYCQRVFSWIKLHTYNWMYMF